MSLFKKRTNKKESNPSPETNGDVSDTKHHHQNGNKTVPEKVADSSVGRPKLVFHCQQAHGSPTGLITGFSNVRELYQKIAECYEFPADDILFCTLNTHKVDMTKLLGGQIGLDDFIFVHRKGRPKEIEIRKTEDALGLTITDNGAGYAFIKRIKEGSVIDSIKHIQSIAWLSAREKLSVCIDAIQIAQVGDHIEKIDSENLVGKRHFEVAKMLKEIPRDSTFTIRLVEPLKDGFINVGPKGDSRKGKKANYGTGKETLRFRANGEAQIEQASDEQQVAIDKINNLLESFMGINDSELATLIWEQAQGKTNSMDFAEAIDNSELEEFGFTDDFIIELWGVITDARSGRLK